MKATVNALMARIQYQLRIATTTTMGPCPRCSRQSPGAQLCADCLSEHLGMLIQNKGAAKRWLHSVRTVTQDENTVMAYAKQVDLKMLEGMRKLPAP